MKKYDKLIIENNKVDSNRTNEKLNYYENDILGYDCDGNEIKEFRVLRFPDSAEIENWEKEPNIDPRFYCLVKSYTNEVFAISVYDDYNRDYIIKYEDLNSKEIPTLVKSVSDMRYYEVAFSGITGNEWYYDRNKEELQQKLDNIIEEKNIKKLIKKK